MTRPLNIYFTFALIKREPGGNPRQERIASRQAEPTHRPAAYLHIRASDPILPNSYQGGSHDSQSASFFRATKVDWRSAQAIWTFHGRKALVHQVLDQLTVFVTGGPNKFSPLIPFPEDSVFHSVEPLALALQDSLRIPKPFHPVLLAI